MNLRQKTMRPLPCYQINYGLRPLKEDITHMNYPKEIAQSYITTGITKSKLPAKNMFVLSIMAGMFIALAGVGATLSSSTIASPSLAKLIGAAVFPVGLAMTIVAGAELFTGNCLIIVSVLEREVKIRAMLRNWCFVYIGNFVGSIIIALLTVNAGTFSAFSNAAAANLINTAVYKVNLDFLKALLSGILCNLLVCIAVWMSYAAKDVVGKIAGLYLPIMLFVLCGFEHSIANMFFLPAGLFASKKAEYLAAFTSLGGENQISSLSWGTLLTRNLIPATIGNIIGGVLFVGISYWFAYLYAPGKDLPAAPVRRGKKKSR